MLFVPTNRNQGKGFKTVQVRPEAKLAFIEAVESHGMKDVDAASRLLLWWAGLSKSERVLIVGSLDAEHIPSFCELILKVKGYGQNLQDGFVSAAQSQKARRPSKKATAE